MFDHTGPNHRSAMIRSTAQRSTGSTDISSFNFDLDPLLDGIDFTSFDQTYGELDIALQNSIPTNTFGDSYTSSIMPSPSELYSLSIGSPTTSNLSTRTDVGSLARLRTKDPVAKKCASLVMQTLRTYPEQMLRRDGLPLFVHPQWHLHTIPEPLAVCMRISQLFDSRTSDVLPFLWRTIKAEQVRCIEEVWNQAHSATTQSKCFAGSDQRGALCCMSSTSGLYHDASDGGHDGACWMEPGDARASECTELRELQPSAC